MQFCSYYEVPLLKKQCQSFISQHGSLLLEAPELKTMTKETLRDILPLCNELDKLKIIMHWSKEKNIEDAQELGQLVSLERLSKRSLACICCYG